MKQFMFYRAESVRSFDAELLTINIAKMIASNMSASRSQLNFKNCVWLTKFFIEFYPDFHQRFRFYKHFIFTKLRA